MDQEVQASGDSESTSVKIAYFGEVSVSGTLETLPATVRAWQTLRVQSGGVRASLSSDPESDSDRDLVTAARVRSRPHTPLVSSYYKFRVPGPGRELRLGVQVAVAAADRLLRQGRWPGARDRCGRGRGCQ
eukprot:3590694-Rhodomonas_salina.1